MSRLTFQRHYAEALSQGCSVRWYLHQVYHKQGLSGQADLVRLVLAVATLV